jgi:hypothetical protein
MESNFQSLNTEPERTNSNLFFQPKSRDRSIESDSLKNGVSAFVQGDEGKDKTPVEKSGDVPTELSTIEIKGSSGSHCEPVGVTYDDFLKKTGNIDNAFGVTKFNSSNVIFPEVVLNNGKLEKTDADVQVSSFYLLPQTFKEKKQVISLDDGDAYNHYCPKGKYDLYWQVTKSAAEKIKEGEQEHCNDITLAFSLSLAKFKDDVNKDAGKSFKSLKKAKAYFKKKTKVDPDNWANYFMMLAKKTEDRDKLNWHLPKNYRTRINQTCDKVEIVLASPHLPEIGIHPSSEIIN